MTTIDEFARELKAFDDRREVVKALRTSLRKPLPPVRKAIKGRALATLPRSGGLNAWVAATRVSAQLKTSGRAAGIRLRGSRKSGKGKADLARLDAGTTRHPSWGRRGPGQWHTQSVTPGFFTNPATEVEQWRTAALDALDTALRTIRG